MECKIEVYEAMCSLSTFEINGIDADEDDFVDKYDHSSYAAEDHACEDMRADLNTATDEVLQKYKITLDEYNAIAENVAGKVSFGCCGLCI